MATLNPSFQANAIKSTVTFFPEDNLFGEGLNNPGLTGVFVAPSDVPGRPADITGYILAAATPEGKLEWTEPPDADLSLGDLTDVNLTNLSDGDVIVYNAATQLWLPAATGGSVIPGAALERVGNVLNVRVDNATIQVNGSNQLELVNDSIDLTAGSGIDVTGSPVPLGGSVTVAVDSTVIRTTGGQTISGTLDVTGTFTAGDIDTPSVSFTDADQSDAVTITAAPVTTAYNLILPPAQGAAGTFLSNDGAGNLSWVAGGGGTLPGGPVNAVQFQDPLGVFSGSAGFTYDGTDVTVTSGSIQAVGVVSTSDVRVKSHVQPLGDYLSAQNLGSPLDVLCNVQGYAYTFDKNDTLEYGVLAQQLESCGLGTAVKDLSNGLKGVNYNHVLTLLIEAVKDLSSQVRDLKG